MEIEIKTKPKGQVEGRSGEPKRQPQPLKPIGFFELFRFATKAEIIVIILCATASAVVGAATPIFAFITGDMIDNFGSGGNVSGAALETFYLYLGLGGIILVIGTFMFSGWMITGQNQAVRCRQEYFKSMLRQQIAWYDTQSQVELVSNFGMDSMAFKLAVGQKISSVITIISMLLVAVGVSFYLGWILTLITLGCLPFIGYCWFNNIATRNQIRRQSQQLFVQTDSKTQQIYQSIKLVKQMNAQEFQTTKYLNSLQALEVKFLPNRFKYSTATIFALFSLYASFALCFWYGGECRFDTKACSQSVSYRPYTAGSVLTIFYALFLPALSLNQLTPSLEKISEGRSAASRIFAIIDRVPLIRSKPDAIIPQYFSGVISFKNVTFAYPKDKSTNIMQNLSMTIDCRSSAIAGRSGCGKSTIFQLIMRFYDPDQGTVMLDGTDLRDLNLDWLRSQIGYVTQQPVLFATSIKQNLLLGKSDASDEEIEEALKKAEAFVFVCNMKDNLQTYVGNGGSLLSGGQKQRIAIARALLKKPRLLLLDEATSALDQQNQRQILNTFHLISSDLITISISHHKRAITSCNKIFYYKNGRIEKTVQKKVNNLLKVQNMDRKYQGSNKMLASNISESNGHLNEVSVFETNSKMINTDMILDQSAAELKEEEEKQNQKKDRRPGLSRILDYLKNYKCLVIIACILSLIDGLTFPLIGLFLSRIISAMLLYETDRSFYQRQVRIFSIAIAGIALQGAIVAGLRQYSYAMLGQYTTRSIKIDTFNKIIKMPVSWFDQSQNQPQIILSKITTGTRALHTFTQRYISSVIIILIGIVISIILAIIFQWRTGLTSLALIPFMMLSQMIQLAFIKGMTESKQKVYTDSSQIVSQSVMNIRTVLSLGGSQSSGKRYQERLQNVYALIFSRSLFSGFMFGLSYLLQYASFGLMFYLAAIFVSNFNVSIEGSLAVIFLISFADISAGNNATFMEDISIARNGATSVFSIIDLQDEQQIWVKDGCLMIKQPIKGNIQFRDVSFRYEGRKRFALYRVNLKFKEGDNIGLVGTSGCGKSTVFRLLLGFYSPTNGQILLQGHNIKQYDLQYLRKSFGVVNQQPILFNESINWNIRYNLNNITNQQILDIARKANFNPMQEITKGQDNYYTGYQDVKQQSVQNLKDTDHSINLMDKNVGPKGRHVSGGQKQRIAIARTLLRNPSILLLDQAMSALDTQNQTKVLAALGKQLKGKTTISITHKLQSTTHLDLLYMFNLGQVEEQGTYSELMKKEGSFFKLNRNSYQE